MAGRPPKYWTKVVLLTAIHVARQATDKNGFGHRGLKKIEGLDELEALEKEAPPFKGLAHFLEIELARLRSPVTAPYQLVSDALAKIHQAYTPSTLSQYATKLRRYKAVASTPQELERTCENLGIVALGLDHLEND